MVEFQSCLGEELPGKCSLPPHGKQQASLVELSPQRENAKNGVS